MADMKSKFSGSTIQVDLGANSYPIYIGAGTLEQFGSLFQQHIGTTGVVVITDDNVGHYYAEPVH